MVLGGKSDRFRGQKKKDVEQELSAYHKERAEQEAEERTKNPDKFEIDWSVFNSRANESFDAMDLIKVEKMPIWVWNRSNKKEEISYQDLYYVRGPALNLDGGSSGSREQMQIIHGFLCERLNIDRNKPATFAVAYCGPTGQGQNFDGVISYDPKGDEYGDHWEACGFPGSPWSDHWKGVVPFQQPVENELGDERGIPDESPEKDKPTIMSLEDTLRERLLLPSEWRAGKWQGASDERFEGKRAEAQFASLRNYVIQETGDNENYLALIVKPSDSLAEPNISAIYMKGNQPQLLVVRDWDNSGINYTRRLFDRLVRDLDYDTKSQTKN